MPRNTTGGSGHKAQRNSEGSKARHNREFIDDLLDDYRKGEKITDVYVGRVLRRMGNGRMEVFYMKTVEEEGLEDLATGIKTASKTRQEPVQQTIPMRGGLRGKGKKSVWVDIDALVMIAETGLAGTTHEIVAVFSPDQIVRYRKLVPDADERLFLKGGSEKMEDTGENVVFEAAASDEIDIDDI